MNNADDPVNPSLESGLLIMVSAPSGAGKTSLVAALLQQVSNLSLSISHTTREKRPGEVAGENYFFVSENEFEQMQAAGAFLEHANVFGNFYATSRATVQTQIKQGADVILEIDWQGAQQIRQNLDNNLSIFILPPSRAALKERLKGRGQDNEQVIEQRMAKANEEMSHYAEFDYLIVNDNFEQALSELVHIIAAARLRTPFQQSYNEQLIESLFVV